MIIVNMIHIILMKPSNKFIIRENMTQKIKLLKCVNSEKIDSIN